MRDDLWEVGARVRIPLGGTTTYALLSPQSRRMQERIERDDDIITVQSGPEQVSDVLTDVRFDRVAFVGSSITTTSANAGDNSLLIAKGGTIVGPQNLRAIRRCKAAARPSRCEASNPAWSPTLPRPARGRRCSTMPTAPC